MGNALGRQAEYGYQPNIRIGQEPARGNAGGGTQNDVNQPYSQQLGGMLSHFSLPMLIIIAYANEKVRQHQETQRLQSKISEAEDRIQQLSAELESAIKYNPKEAETVKKLNQKYGDIITDEEHIAKKQLADLKYFEVGLRSVLDIRCSPFKKRKTRELLQDEMIVHQNDLDSNLRQIVRYRQLKDVFDNDGKFCGKCPGDNGKLRHLYVRQWELEVEKQKHKRILNKIMQLKDSS